LNVLVLIVENEVIGGKRLDDSRAIRIHVIIDLVLVGLGVFADTGADIARKS
jgi:hypothetical protein